MKLYVLIAFVLAGGAFCPAKLAAQSTSNAVLTAALNLTAYIQQTNDGLPAVKIQKLTTKDIIATIGSDLGKTSNDLSGAKFLLKLSNLGDTNQNGELHAVLRTSGGDTNLDGIFVLDFVSFQTVKTVRSNVKTGTSLETDHMIFSVSLTTTNLAFQTQGHLKLGLSSIFVGTKVFDPRAFPAAYAISVTGSGTVGTNAAVFAGTFIANNRKLE